VRVRMDDAGDGLWASPRDHHYLSCGARAVATGDGSDLLDSTRLELSAFVLCIVCRELGREVEHGWEWEWERVEGADERRTGDMSTGFDKEA
jgi:hypothetical protein